MDIKEEYAKKILDYLVMEGKLTEEDLKKVKLAIPSPLVEDAMRIIHALCCIRQHDTTCLLYTSDAADDLLCVDLGCHRITKKKKYNKKSYSEMS